jgi:hypothetical protein
MLCCLYRVMMGRTVQQVLTEIRVSLEILVLLEPQDLTGLLERLDSPKDPRYVAHCHVTIVATSESLHSQ